MDTVSPTSLEPPASVRAARLSRTDVALLAGAPVVLALGRMLLVPFDDQRWDHMLSDMAVRSSRNAIGWSLTLIAAALLVAAGLALVRLVPDRPRLTAPALIGVALGWVGTAAVASGGLVMTDMADSPDREAMVKVLAGFNEGTGNTIFFLVLAGVIGNVLLAVALSRSGVAARGAAALLGSGAVLSLVGAPGPVKPIAVSGAVLLLGAHLLLIRDPAVAPNPGPRFVATVSAALLLLSAGVASAAPSQARGSAPQIIDPAGDANGLSTVLPYSNVQTPAVSQADADVTSVLWRVVKDKKRKVIGFTVQARLSAAPRADTKVAYRMLGTPVCGAQFGVIYNSNPNANPYFGPRSAVRDTCTPSGEVRYTAIPFPKIVGTTITWTVPLTAIPKQVNIVAGTTITDLRFGVYTVTNHAGTGFETYVPIMDDGRTKTAFSFT